MFFATRVTEVKSNAYGCIADTEEAQMKFSSHGMRIEWIDDGASYGASTVSRTSNLHKIRNS
jgi:hypothetical protein